MIPRSILLFTLLFSLSMCSSRGQDLLWSDEFDSIDGPDTNVWSYGTGGDDDGFQVYNEGNVEVRGSSEDAGALHSDFILNF